ncbi:HEPN domain-containing protein [Bacillus toyonensis]|uniref:HEPN domain-containing protein n=1 Tax=Bacillus toyonensis TaxID=155322 RepID=UPI003D6471E7
MKSVLIEFQTGLSELKKFIENSQFQKKVFTIFNKFKETGVHITPVELEEQFKGFIEHYRLFSNKQIFEYNTIIISMYGYFEAFIEDIIKAYILNLSEFINDFKKMPLKIQENHSALSAILIQNLTLPKYQNVTTVDKVIINAHSCVIGNNNYTINLDAYTYHTSNFRNGSVDEFFTKVGINQISSLILCHPRFEQYLIENEINKAVAFEKIDDLAERRNQVAHGGHTELLSLDILLDYINFFELYSGTFYEVLMMEIVKFRLENDLAIISLEPPLETYGRHIACFNIVDRKICVGDSIYAKTNNPSEPVRYGIIESIRCNDQSCQVIEATESVHVGLKVNFKVRENYQFYVEQRQRDKKVLESV